MREEEEDGMGAVQKREPTHRRVVGKKRENLAFFKVFDSPAMVPKSIKNAPKTASEAPKLSPKWQAILPLAWLILKVSCPIWVATYHQLGPSFGHLRSNFAGFFKQMTPCTRRNAPKAPKILSAFNISIFDSSRAPFSMFSVRSMS